MPSPREQAQEQIAAVLREQETDRWTAPFGVLCGMDPNKKYRSITFGVARTLDAHIMIYSPRFIIYHDSRGRNEKFKSVEELLAYVKGL